MALLAGWLGWGAYHRRAAERAMARRDFAEARRLLGLSLRMSADGQTLLLASRAARRGGADDEAEKLLSAAAKAGAAPDGVALERELSRFQAGDLGDAERYLAACEAHPDKPESALILEALIRGSLKAMRLDLARRSLDVWGDRGGEEDAAQARVWRADLAIRTGDLDGALAHLRAAVAARPDDASARLKLAELLTRYAPAEALKHLAWLREKKPSDRDVMFELARCRRALGEHDDAAALLDILLSRAPRDAALLLERGQVALDVGELADAERWLRAAEAQAPERRDVGLALARVLQQAGREPEAQAYRDKVAKLDADLAERARKLMEKGRLP